MNSLGENLRVSSEQLVDGISLLDIGAPEPTTLELLTGAADLNSAGGTAAFNGTDLLGGGFDPFSDSAAKPNSFDPFVSMGSHPKPAPVKEVPKKESSGLDFFDPFQDLPGGNSATESMTSSFQGGKTGDGFLGFSDKKSSNGGSGANLIGGWSGSGIAGGAGTTNVTSPEFVGPGMGIGGVGARTQPSPMGVPPAKTNDPFADIGKFLTFYCVFHRSCPQSLLVSSLVCELP